MTALLDVSAITPTSKGFRVDKKIAGHDRLRKTFPTYEEAEHALRAYLRGEGETVAAIAKASVTWRDLYDNALRRRWRKLKSTNSSDNATRIIEQFLGWDSDVRLFDQKAADVLAQQLEVEGRSLVTVSKYLSAIRFMLKLGYEWGMITWKLPKLEHHAQGAEGRINFFTYDDEERIANIMRQCAREDMADLFTVLVETGMRTSEGAYLQWRDVDLAQRVVRIWGTDTKTGKNRRVPLTDRAFEVLARLRESAGAEPRVFPRATKSFLRSTWESIRKATGNTDKDFVWYTTRHTCASRLMRAGVDIKTIQVMLGHNRIETTMRYIQFSNGSLVGAAGALDAARKLAQEVDTAVTELA